MMRLVQGVVFIFALMLLMTSLVLSLGRRSQSSAQWIIAFSHRTDGSWWLVNILPNGKIIQSPTENQGSWQWSPDNEWVAYTHHDGAYERLYVARPDGRQRRVLMEDRSVNDTFGSVKWSPDGRWIAMYHGRDPTVARLTIMSWIGNKRYDVFYTGMLDDFEWSPDGEWLAVTIRGENLQSALFRVWRDGSGLKRLLTKRNLSIFEPRFAPDGQSFYFSANDQAATHIYQSRLDGNAVERLTDGGNSNFILSISPNGEWMNVSSNRDNVVAALYRVNSDGGDWIKLAEGFGFWSSDSIWSADGQQLMFNIGRIDEERLMLHRLDGDTTTSIFVAQLGRFPIAPHFLPFPNVEWNGWRLALLGGVMGVMSMVGRRH